MENQDQYLLAETPSNKRDFFSFLLCCALVFGAWVVFFGWRPGLLFSSSDGLDYVYPAVHFLRENITQNIYYDPSWLGGAKVNGVWTSPWFLTAALKLHFSAATAVFLALVIPQVLLSFASWQFLNGLAESPGNSSPRSLFRQSLWILLFAFPPFLGWRFLAGHFFYSSLLAVGVCALLAQMGRRRLSSFGAFLLVATLASTVQSASYQQIISSVYVGIPLLAILSWKLRPSKTAWVVFAGFGASALLWSLREQAEMWLHFTGGDASRSEKGAEIVFSFVTANWRDWVSSLFWQKNLLGVHRSSTEIFETNFAFGPLLALLLAGGRTARWRSLRYAILVLVAVVIGFTSNFYPMTKAVFFLAPPLQYFRVPARIFLSLLFCALPIAVVFLEERMRLGDGTGKRSTKILLALGFAVAIFLGPPWIKEILIWTLLAALVTQKYLFRFGGEALLFPLALASILAFGQRLPPALDLGKTEENVAELRAKILAASPILVNPLMRATLDFQDGKFRNNTAHILGISSLDGYWQPLKSYNLIASEAYGVAASPFSLNFRIPTAEPSAAKLFHLFNVRYQVRIEPDGSIVAKEIKSGGEAAWLLDADTDKPCAGASVKSISILEPYFSARTEITGNHFPCRLVFALNFAENLRAYNQDGTRVFPRPALGGLFSVDLPADTTTVDVRAEAMAPAWLGAAPYLSALLLVFAIAGWKFHLGVHRRR